MNGLFNAAMPFAQNQSYNNMAGQLQGLQSLFPNGAPANGPAFLGSNWNGYGGGQGRMAQQSPGFPGVLGQGQAGDMQGHTFNGRLNLNNPNDPRILAAKAAYAQKMGGAL